MKPLDPAPSIGRSEFAARQAAVAGDAAERGLDALLVWSTGGSSLYGCANVLYLANHYSPVPRVVVEIEPFMTGWGQTALVVPASGEPPTLVVEVGDWRRDLVAVDDVRHDHDLYAEVVATLRDAGLAEARVGLVGAPVMPVSAWQTIARALPGLRFEPADDILYARRRIKSDAEIAMMRHACAVGAEIQNAMLPLAEEGRTDNDLARAGYAACCDFGAVPWEFAFASGPHSAHGYWGRLPAWDRETRYARGDLVHPDAYGSVNGYLYDLQRTVVVGGEPTPAQRRILDGVVGVVDALCAAALAGTPVADLARLSESWLTEHGFGVEPAPDAGDALTPLVAVGHGLGTGFELPWVDSSSADRLEPGMTIALEVYVGEEGTGTAVTEEVVLVTADGPEILTAGCPSRRW